MATQREGRGEGGRGEGGRGGAAGTALALGACAALVWVAYEGARSHQFTFDDHLAIEGNGDVQRALDNETHIWTDDIWGKDLRAVDSHKSYRPLLVEAFRFLWHLLPSPQLFRAVSMALHALASFFAFATARRISSSNSVALATGLLFAAHPVHVEAVTACVNMAEPLYSLLVFIAHLSVSRAYSAGQAGRVLYVGAYVAAVTVGVLCKETAVVVCLSTVAFVVSRVVVKALARASLPPAERATVSVASTLDGVLVAVSAALVYLYFASRFVLTHPRRDEVLAGSPAQIAAFALSFAFEDSSAAYLNASELIRRAENPFAFLTGRTRLLSMLHLYYRYAEAMVWPSAQSPEYSFDCISAVDSVADTRFLAAAALLAGLLALSLLSITVAVRGLRRAAIRHEALEQHAPAFALMDGLLWLLISFLPATGAVFTLGTLLAERLMYLPSFAVCLLLALGGRAACRAVVPRALGKGPALGVYGALMGALVAAYVYKTRAYNIVWASDETLFRHTIAVCPRSAKAHLQVSKLHSMRDELPQAWEHLRTSQQLDPQFCDHGYQTAHLHAQEANEALRQLQLRPEDAEELEEQHSEQLGLAAAAALANLPCIYTNRQALDLLTKLWSYQLDHANQRFLQRHPTAAGSANKNAFFNKQLATQAKDSYVHQLFHLAARKYTDLSVNVFDAGEHQRAYNYASLALKATARFFEDAHVAPLDDSLIDQRPALGPEALAAYSLHCRAAALLAAYSSSPKTQADPVAVRARVLQAGGRPCVFVAAAANYDPDRAVGWEHVRISANAYVQGFYAKVKKPMEGRPEELHERAEMLTVALALDRSTPGAQTAQVQAQVQAQARRLWQQAAQAAYQTKQFHAAAQRFAMLLLLDPAGPAPLSLLDAVATFSSRGSVELARHVDYWVRNNATVWSGRDLAQLEDCTDFYWYADSLAGLGDEVFLSTGSVELILSLMEQLKACLAPRPSARAHLGAVDALIAKFSGQSRALREPREPRESREGLCTQSGDR